MSVHWKPHSAFGVGVQAAAAAEATDNIACAAEAQSEVAVSEGHKKPLAAATNSIAADGVKATQTLDSRDSLEDDRCPKRVKSAAKDIAALKTQVKQIFPCHMPRWCPKRIALPCVQCRPAAGS